MSGKGAKIKRIDNKRVLNRGGLSVKAFNKLVHKGYHETIAQAFIAVGQPVPARFQ